MSPGTGASEQVPTDSSAPPAGETPAPTVAPMGPSGPAPVVVPPPEPGEATLELSGAGQGGQVIVTSPRGKLLGSYAVGPGQTILLRGAPGEYVVRSPTAPHGLVVPVVDRTHVQVGPTGLAMVRDEGPRRVRWCASVDPPPRATATGAARSRRSCRRWCPASARWSTASTRAGPASCSGPCLSGQVPSASRSPATHPTRPRRALMAAPSPPTSSALPASGFSPAACTSSTWRR
ncbi:hypothetical protein [Nannocystis pusilla]|uniref:hypothetical protein n=1 Tax=Nannocystis pusilla TaxID=889268 RepID=UPI003B7894F4